MNRFGVTSVLPRVHAVTSDISGAISSFVLPFRVRFLHVCWEPTLSLDSSCVSWLPLAVVDSSQTHPHGESQTAMFNNAPSRSVMRLLSARCCVAHAEIEGSSSANSIAKYPNKHRSQSRPLGIISMFRTTCLIREPLLFNLRAIQASLVRNRI